MIEQGPGRPYLRVAVCIALVAAAIVFVATRGGHHPRRVTTPVNPLPTAPLVVQPELPRELSGVPMRPPVRATMLLGGNGLTEFGVDTKRTRRLMSTSTSSPVQLLTRRGGVVAVLAADCSRCAAPVVFIRAGGSTALPIGTALAVVADVADDRIWLINSPRSTDLRQSNVSLVDVTGRVIRAAQDVDLDTVFHGTSGGLLGYSANAGAIELWNPATGNMRHIATVPTRPVLIDASNSAAAWTDFAAECYAHCVHVLRMDNATHVSTFSLPSNYVIALQPNFGAMSPDGTRLGLVVRRTGMELANVQVLVTDLASHEVTQVPGTRLSPDDSGVRLSIAWDRASTALWIADSDDRDGLPVQLGRWPLRGPLRLVTAAATDVTSIAQVDPTSQ